MSAKINQYRENLTHFGFFSGINIFRVNDQDHRTGVLQSNEYFLFSPLSHCHRSNGLQ